ncbi:MAG TPA: GTP-binding protein [Usitatibacter sp.]|nr:GTP-binding protein [Usitatibacter sp.]
MAASGLTPVTVLTGFLGSGKTTLAAALVADPRFTDTAIIVNELGEASIDHALLRHASGDVVQLAGGCLCCRAAGDIVRALRELHHRRTTGAAPFRRVVIETTGLADPAPLLATLVELPVTAARYALSGVVVTVDSERGMGTLDAHPESVKQVAVADRIVVTKADRVQPAPELLQRLAGIAPGARIVTAARGALDGALLFDAGLSRGGSAPPDARGWLNEGAYASHGRAVRHDPRISSFVWRRAKPLAWDDLEDALETLRDAMGARILRMKGLVAVAGEPGPRAVHMVQHALYPAARLPAWPDADRSTRLVFIGRDLEEGAVAQILDSLTRETSTPPE